MSNPYRVSCPTCGAFPGVPCQGRGELIDVIHLSRRRAATSRERSMAMHPSSGWAAGTTASARADRRRRSG